MQMYTVHKLETWITIRNNFPSIRFPHPLIIVAENDDDTDIVGLSHSTVRPQEWMRVDPTPVYASFNSSGPVGGSAK